MISRLQARRYTDRVVDGVIATSPNLFDKSTATQGYYIQFDTNVIHPVAWYAYSDYIPVKPNTVYTANAGTHFVFYDSSKSYLSGVENATNQHITTPFDAAYIRFTVFIDPLSLLDTVMFVEGDSLPHHYIRRGRMLTSESVDTASIPEFKILLPSTIYLTVGERFSIYYENIIYKSQAFNNGAYYIVQEQKNGDGSYTAKGTGYMYKWEYTPVETDTTFTMEFRIVATYSHDTVASKLVSFVVSPAITGKTANVYTIGDSFTDDCGIVVQLSNMFKTRQSGANTPSFKGVNSAGSQWVADDPDAVGVYDDAFSGETYFFYTNRGKYTWLRYDRPLSDAIWDEGWGENEPSGWTTGQTFADLTEEQKSHGHTKNQFWNFETDEFDFGYYMNTYQSSGVADAFFMMCGINDAVWNDPVTLKSKLPEIKAQMVEIIDSVHAYSPTIKVCIHTMTPHMQDQNFLSTQNTFIHYQRAKYCQELFNEMVLTNFDTPEMQAANVFVMPSGANYDTRSSLETATTHPDKFSPTYTETHSSSIHPNREIGAAYIADTMYNYVYNLGLR
jgi:hypothetical protein